MTRAQSVGISAAKQADVARLYDGTRVTDLSERLKMFDETAAQLRARHDPLLDFAFVLEPERQAWQAGIDARDGAIARLRPEWRKAVLAHAGKPVAPDANGTLRVSFAQVRSPSGTTRSRVCQNRFPPFGTEPGDRSIARVDELDAGFQDECEIEQRFMAGP